MTPEQIHDLSRIYPFHSARQSARPVDAFTSAYPQIYDYRVDPQWHQLTFYNTDPDHETKIGVNLAGDTADGALGLDASHDYYIYDFWNDLLIGKNSGKTHFEQMLRPGEARMMAIHQAMDRPQVLSTDRHLMQGYVDLLGTDWDATHKELRGVSTVVGGEPYRLIIATNGLKARAATADETISRSLGASRPDQAKENAIVHLRELPGDAGLIETSITRPDNGPVAWTVMFENAR